MNYGDLAYSMAVGESAAHAPCHESTLVDEKLRGSAFREKPGHARPRACINVAVERESERGRELYY